MSLKRMFFSLLCVFCLMFFSFAVTPKTAEASTCPPNCYNGFFSDFGTTAGGLTSVFTTIQTPATYPANYSNSGSWAWPMIVNTSSGAYAQVGWGAINNETGTYGTSTITKPNGVHYFYEINYGDTSSGGNMCTDCDYQIYSTNGPATSSSHDYRVFLQNGNWVGTVDNLTIGSMSTNWNASLFGYGNEAQYFEEINGSSPYNSAFIGTISSHARFSNIRAYANGITYYSPTPSIHSDTDGAYTFANYSAGSSSSSSYVDFWDSRYQ